MIIKGKNKRTIREMISMISTMKGVFQQLSNCVISCVGTCLPITESRLKKAKKLAVKEAEENNMPTDDINNGMILKHLLALCMMRSCGFPPDFPIAQDIMENTKLITKEYMESNPYFQKIKLGNISKETVQVSGEIYHPMEIVPLSSGYIDGTINVGMWGIATEEITYPKLIIEDEVWMSISPSEIETMHDAVTEAHGNALVLGLGMGYYAYMIHLKDNVSRVTVVEHDENVISIFKEFILPQFDFPEKVEIIHKDAYEYLGGLSKGSYNFCFADLWLNVLDGIQHYVSLIPYEMKLGIQFKYWIEDAMLGMLSDAVAGWIILEHAGVADNLKNTVEDTSLKISCQITEDMVLSTPEDIFDAIKIKNIKKRLYEHLSCSNQ